MDTASLGGVSTAALFGTYFLVAAFVGTAFFLAASLGAAFFNTAFLGAAVAGVTPAPAPSGERSLH